MVFNPPVHQCALSLLHINVGCELSRGFFQDRNNIEKLKDSLVQKKTKMQDICVHAYLSCSHSVLATAQELSAVDHWTACRRKLLFFSHFAPLIRALNT